MPTTLLAHQRAIWMHRSEFAFAVAEPLGVEDGVLWLSAVPGSLAGPEHAARAGAALVSLHRSGVRAAPSVDRTERAAAELVRIVPSLRREVEALLVPVDAGAPRPLHGSPHPPQWLADGDRLGLIDFDRLGSGTSRRTSRRTSRPRSVEDGGEAVAAAFLAGYGPLDSRRLDAYRRRRRILKALRAATSLRPDGDERAARRLRGG